jgi:mutator protein MutT
MIFEKQPDNFNSSCEVVSCFVECNGNILILHRQDHKPQGNTWGVPAGKIDSGESLVEALKREVEEETGLRLENPKYFKKFFVRYPEFDFIYYVFHEQIEGLPEVRISEGEHKAFLWIEPSKALELPLILDEDLCIKSFYNLK